MVLSLPCTLLPKQLPAVVGVDGRWGSHYGRILNHKHIPGSPFLPSDLLLRCFAFAGHAGEGAFLLALWVVVGLLPVLQGRMCHTHWYYWAVRAVCAGNVMLPAGGSLV